MKNKKRLFVIYCLMSLIPAIVVQMFCVKEITSFISAKNDTKVLIGLAFLCVWVAGNIFALNLLYGKFVKIMFENNSNQNPK